MGEAGLSPYSPGPGRSCRRWGGRPGRGGGATPAAPPTPPPSRSSRAGGAYFRRGGLCAAWPGRRPPECGDRKPGLREGPGLQPRSLGAPPGVGRPRRGGDGGAG